MHAPIPRLIGEHFPAQNMSPEFDQTLMEQALVDGLEYLKMRLHWSGHKIADVLHFSPTTVNTWLKQGKIPLNDQGIKEPRVQAIIHLLAIHRSLEAMFEDPANQRTWLLAPHPVLGAVPEKLMSESIEKLIFVRQYLDYVRGRGA